MSSRSLPPSRTRPRPLQEPQDGPWTRRFKRCGLVHGNGSTSGTFSNGATDQVKEALRPWGQASERPGGQLRRSGHIKLTRLLINLVPRAWTFSPPQAGCAEGGKKTRLREGGLPRPCPPPLSAPSKGTAVAPTNGPGPRRPTGIRSRKGFTHPCAEAWRPLDKPTRVVTAAPSQARERLSQTQTWQGPLRPPGLDKSQLPPLFPSLVRRPPGSFLPSCPRGTKLAGLKTPLWSWGPHPSPALSQTRLGSFTAGPLPPATKTRHRKPPTHRLSTDF